LGGVSGRRSAQRLDSLFGSDEWVAIHQMRRAGDITPEEMRAEFVNLLRWRLEEVLNYKTTHALQIVNTSGQPLYTLVFATDSAVGDHIMRQVYDSAATRTLPEMRRRAQIARQRRREGEMGIFQLPGFEAVTPGDPVHGIGYDHIPPWPPPVPSDERLVLEGGADDDPDDIDEDRWVRENEIDGGGLFES
ncbi:MAG: hypothetical protein WBG41_16980, partial [Acidimicrobiales bacterium]